MRKKNVFFLKNFCAIALFAMALILLPINVQALESNLDDYFAFILDDTGNVWSLGFIVDLGNDGQRIYAYKSDETADSHLMAFAPDRVSSAGIAYREAVDEVGIWQLLTRINSPKGITEIVAPNQRETYTAVYVTEGEVVAVNGIRFINSYKVYDDGTAIFALNRDLSDIYITPGILLDSQGRCAGIIVNESVAYADWFDEGIYTGATSPSSGGNGSGTEPQGPPEQGGNTNPGGNAGPGGTGTDTGTEPVEEVRPTDLPVVEPEPIVEEDDDDEDEDEDEDDEDEDDERGSSTSSGLNTTAIIIIAASSLAILIIVVVIIIIISKSKKNKAAPPQNGPGVIPPASSDGQSYQTPVQTPAQPYAQTPAQAPAQTPVQPPVQAPVQTPVQPVSQPASGSLFLVCTGGYQDGQEFPVNGVVTMGRDPGCTIRYPGDYAGISREHAVLTVRNDKIYLIDTSSTGVFLDKTQARIPSNQQTEIAVGDIFYLGERKNQFRLVRK
ncbi:MAG: FHA domain-containing protein [Lachnospiraceae bacterium]|nr:FHA domain-containing protein [Lachnospiraceae bacterium]